MPGGFITRNFGEGENISHEQLHRCHCEGVRSTLKTLSYDCGNPVIICLRANARSAFLFTGSPRSFHSLAMTKGTKWLIPQSLTTPAASHHPSNGGELGSSRRGTKFPSTEGCRDTGPHENAIFVGGIQAGVSYFARRGWGTRVTSNYFSVESCPQFMLQYTQPMVCPLGRGVETPSNVFIMNKELQTRVGEW